MQEAFISVATNIAFRLAFILLSLLAVYALALAKAYLQARIGETKYNMLKSKAEVVVRALEQAGILPQWDGQYKKTMAMSIIGAAANEIGLELSDEDKSDLIESVVQIMNTEAGKFTPKFELSTPQTFTLGSEG